MKSKQPNKDKNHKVEVCPSFKHASLFSRCRNALNSFAHSDFFFVSHSQRRDRKPSLRQRKNISSLTIWLTAVFRAKVPLVWKTFSVTHFLGYSAIREEWNKKVKQEREREEREQRRESKRKGYLSGVISAFQALWLVQHIPRASHPSSTLRSTPMGLHFPFPIWSFQGWRKSTSAKKKKKNERG